MNDGDFMHDYFDKMFKDSSMVFYNTMKENMINSKKMFIVTANPETFSYGTNEYFNKLLLDDITTIVPDGIGIVMAGRILKYSIKERIAGIDITIKLLEYSNELSKKVYLFGSKQEVIDNMLNVIKGNYPNIKVVGLSNGYVEDKDNVFKDIKQKKPDVVLVALGIPNQEKLIYRHLSDFKKGIFIGIGGSLDVLSGTKKRAPKIFLKLNLEWLYRICSEPSRIKRFYNNNIKFIFKVLKMKK